MFRKAHSRSMLGGNFIGHVAAFLTIGMWGYSFVSSKVLLENGLGPVQIYMARFLIAYLLIAFISHKRLWALNLRDEGQFCICGLCAGSLYFIAENTALKYTLTTNVSLLTSMSPLLTAMLVGLIYKNEKLGIGTWLGSAIAILGVGCVVFNSSTAVAVNPLGDFLSLAAAFSWAIYSLVLRSLNANYDVWFISRKTFFYGLLTAIPFLIFENDTVDLPDVRLTPKIPINTEILEKKPRSGVPPPQASIATKNQSGPCSGTLPEGDPSPVAIFIIPALSMTRRE